MKVCIRVLIAGGAMLFATRIAYADMPVVLDLAVPESPAAAAVAGKAAPVLKPSTPREFAASLISVVDRKGKLSPGVSLEASPYFMIYGSAQVRGYEDGAARAAILRAFVRTQISIATGVADKEAGKAQSVALGLRVPLFDDGDPRLDPLLDACFSAAIPKPKLDSLPPPDQLQTTEELPAEVKAGLKRCYDVSRMKLWNAASMTLAAAQLYSDDGEDKADLKRRGTTLWLSYAHPIGPGQTHRIKVGEKAIAFESSPGQFIAEGKYVRGAFEEGAAPADERKYDAAAIGLRLRWGSDRLNLTAAGSNEWRKFSMGGRKETAKIFSGGFEGRLQKDLWLKLLIGTERKSVTGNEPFASMVVSWSSESEPAFDPRPK